MGFLDTLLGGLVGGIGSYEGAKMQADAQNQANVFNYDIGEQNLAQQQQFAQQSAGWKLSDLVNTAKTVGINPLAALGVSGTSFSNIVANQQPASAGAGLAAGGQSLGRAIAAGQSDEERAFTTAQRELQLQNLDLQNQAIQASINRTTNPTSAGNVSVPPPIPMPVPRPDFSQEPGGFPMWRDFLAPDGSRVIAPSKEWQGEPWGADMKDVWERMYKSVWGLPFGTNSFDIRRPGEYPWYGQMKAIPKWMMDTDWTYNVPPDWNVVNRVIP